MKAIMVMFDSLNRHMLPPYGCDWVHAPNFQRLARRSVTFDRCYVGSMPCMPARRDLHTGRQHFLHRSWGPIEPFDDSMPHILKNADIATHLVTDHYHYWEDGGCTYHSRYRCFELVRGQEGDPWKGDRKDPTIARPNPAREGFTFHQDWINRSWMQAEADQPQARTFALGLDYLARNHDADNWFLQIETFDPHEPYFVPQRFQDLYPHHYAGPHWDWPAYQRVSQDPEAVAHMRYMNAALVSMCDESLGKVLDAMDTYGLWEDTLLIVNTDHGFLLGEHDWWAKCAMPFYEEVAHTPLFIWDPRCGRRDERRRSLVQMMDLPATLLDYFGAPRPADMLGQSLAATIERDTPVREAAIFGMFGGHVNCTDGRYVYMRAPAQAENAPLFEYTHMPTHMRHMFSVEEMRTAEMHPPFAFTKGCPVMRVNARGRVWVNAHEFGTLLFDLERDPGQQQPLHDPAVEARMIDHLVGLMRAHDAPPEQFERLGL